MEVRQARIEDCEWLGHGMKAVVDEGRWLATESDATVEELVERFRTGISAGHLVLLLEQEGEPVGTLGLHPSGVDGVWPDNAAIMLYRSAGFQEEGLRREHYRRLDGSLRSALIMARLFP